MSGERQNIGQIFKSFTRRGRPQQGEALQTPVTTESLPRLVLEPVPAVDIPQVTSPATLAEATIGVMERHKQGQDRSRPDKSSDKFGATLAEPEEEVELPTWELHSPDKLTPYSNISVFSSYKTNADGTQTLKIEPYDEEGRIRWETYFFIAKPDGNIQVLYDRRWATSDVPDHYTVDLIREGANWDMSATKGFRGKEGSATPVLSDEMDHDIFFRMNHYLQMAASGPM